MVIILPPFSTGQASSATAEQSGKLTESMAELAWDFAIKEGFRVFKEMPATQTLTRSYHTWAGPRSPRSPMGVRSHSTVAAASPSHEAKGGLIISPEGLSPRVRKLHDQLLQFIEQKVYPLEPELQRHQASADRWSPSPLIEDLKVSSLSVWQTLATEVRGKESEWNPLGFLSLQRGSCWLIRFHPVTT